MSSGTVSNEAIAPNAKRLLWAGFLAILAAGIGFGIRGGILANWAADFGFTGAQLGAIGGAGFTGFCFGIIIGGVVVDKIGYGKLVVAAFLFHVLSAFITFAATKGQAQATAYMFLYIGTFVFALANGTLEAVANPLVSTLFPHNRTHYLNILHASWPAGLVLGGLVGWILGEGMQVSWKVQLGLFLVPTALYGVAFFGQHFPEVRGVRQGPQHRSDASGSGNSRSARGVLPGGPVLQGATGWHSRVLHREPVLRLCDLGLPRLGRRLRSVADRRRQDQLFRRIDAPVRAVRDPRARRRGRARHRRLDSEHHRQHPDAGPGQDPLRVHVAAHVLAALLRRLHREEPQDLSDRPALHLLCRWRSSVCEW